MPTYEYACKACGHRFEVVRSIHDDALTECPDCGGELRKVFAPPAISFKGSGFYATDHRKKAKSAAEHRTDGQKEGQKEGQREGQKDTQKQGQKTEGQKNEGQKREGASGDASGSKASSGPEKGSTKGPKTGDGGSAP